MKNTMYGLTAISIFVVASASGAADPVLTCHSGKLKLSAKYGACRLNAEAKGIKTSSTPDYSKCETTFSDKWQGAETKAGLGVCVTEMDESAVGDRITSHAGAIATQLSGGVPVDPYSPASGQTTTYGPGDDGDVQPGATLAYQDNGDGTVTDLNTGLMWEKKVGGTGGSVNCTTETVTCANPHHASNRYTWSAVSPNYDGRAVSIFLNQLNNRCNDDTTVSCTVDADCAVPGGPCGFAGHRDWRLPSVKELQGIVDFDTSFPSVDAAFHGASCGGGCLDLSDPTCSCTQSSNYWSSSTYQSGPSAARVVRFLRWGHGRGQQDV